jgi:hypothetical protein
MAKKIRSYWPDVFLFSGATSLVLLLTFFAGGAIVL